MNFRSDAARFISGKCPSLIGRVCNGFGNLKSAYGYKWEWVKKDEIVEKPTISVPIKKDNKEIPKRKIKATKQRVIEV